MDLLVAGLVFPVTITNPPSDGHGTILRACLSWDVHKLRPV